MSENRVAGPKNRVFQLQYKSKKEKRPESCGSGLKNTPQHESGPFPGRFMD
jgi:hypothetical protein